MCTSKIVSVRPFPRSPPVESSACCCGLRSPRLSDPTNNQLVPLAEAGRSGYSLNTVIRRSDDSIQIAVASVAIMVTSPKVKALRIIRRPHRIFFLTATRWCFTDLGGLAGFAIVGGRPASCAGRADIFRGGLGRGGGGSGRGGGLGGGGVCAGHDVGGATRASRGGIGRLGASGGGPGTRGGTRAGGGQGAGRRRMTCVGSRDGGGTDGGRTRGIRSVGGSAPGYWCPVTGASRCGPPAVRTRRRPPSR